MASRRLNILTMTSLLLFLALLLGYVGSYEVEWSRLWATGGGNCTAFGAGCFVRNGQIILDYGLAHNPTVGPLDYGLFWQGKILPMTLPSLRSSLWRFDAFSLSASVHSLALVFPIWCVALPCLIAPGLWLQKRRKQRSRGFSVLPASAGVDLKQS